MYKKNTICLVDSDSSVLRGLTRLILAGGYKVLPYTSFDEFLKSPTADNIACIILDARVLSLSGRDLRAQLLKKALELPVIFVSADDDEQTRKRALSFNATGFFRKPIDGRALLDAITWALEKARQPNEH